MLPHCPPSLLITSELRRMTFEIPCPKVNSISQKRGVQLILAPSGFEPELPH